MTAKDAHTPIPATTKLSCDEHEKTVDQTLYRSMIGNILYLTTSMPDLDYSVGVFASYQANPKESHLIAVKCILKYVKATLDHRIWYSKDSSTDWVSNVDDRKSTSCGCFFVRKNLIAWLSKKQKAKF